MGSKGEQIKRENHRKGSVVNVNPTNIRPQSDSPEIRKYKKKFNTEVLCAGLWGLYFYFHVFLGGRLSCRARWWCWGLRLASALCCRRQSAGGDGERPVAAGPQRSGESLLTHQQTEVPADGRAGRTQRTHHYIRYLYAMDAHVLLGIVASTCRPSG